MKALQRNKTRCGICKMLYWKKHSCSKRNGGYKLTVEEILKLLYDGGTYYEKKNNIKVVGHIFLFDEEDAKVIQLLKSDGQKGLVFVYRIRKSGKFFFMYPSVTQINALEVFLKNYEVVNNENAQYWKN